jgi:hypothetical protein
MDQQTQSKRLARGTHEVSQGRNVGTISPDAPRVYWQAQAFSQIQIQSGIVQFRQAETLRRQNPIYPRRIDGPGRAMALPRPARQLIKLFPISFVPGRHFILAANALGVSLPQMLLRFPQPFGCCSRVLGSPLLVLCITASAKLRELLIYVTIPSLQGCFFLHCFKHVITAFVSKPVSLGKSL